jgi:TetR/AcrR family transcriptional regulator, transcriptional repressor of bet genes
VITYPGVMAGVNRARVAPADKHDRRRSELAESALRTLGELGYARTSLREIASNSEFSHGVVHYYFADKLDLIVYCVRYYKARCVTRYDDVIAEATSADGLVEAFAAKLAETIRDEGPMHSLWYDLRSQSMFEPGLREAVMLIDRTLEEMIWRVIARYAGLAGREARLSAVSCYAMLDGLFQQALLGHVAGHADALSRLCQQVREVMPLMLEGLADNPSRPTR